MEARQSEQLEFDELEKLLCEIPNVTSANPNPNSEVKTKIHQSPLTKDVETLEMNSLASAFSDLSFNAAGVPMDSKKQTLDSSVMIVPSFRAPNNNMPCGFYGDFEGSNLSRFNNAAQRRHQVANYQPYLSNVALPGVQMFVDPQNRVPQQAGQQHQISWTNEEEEQRLYEMQLQYLNIQRLHNQQLENGNRFLSQQYQQQFKQGPIWNGYAVPRGSNQSSIEFGAMRAWDKVAKQSYPERNFGRSQSLNMNMPNGVKFGSFGPNELLSHGFQSGKVLPNGGHFMHSVYNSGSYQFDDVRSWESYLDPTVIRSADFKSLPIIRYESLTEVTGRIYLMAKDQYGCRFLQRKFAEGTREEIEMIFSEIIDHIVDLMTDPFGNYLVQKLLEVCNEDQRMKILHSITRNEGDLVRVSCDMHGTRAVQKIIETLKTADQFSILVSSLDYNAVVLMKNMNGNHVAQKCLQHLIPEFSKFLFDAATRNCVELARDRHGCCVLQKCLSHSDGEQRSRLICEVAANALILSQDPFGNYVVQFVFDLKLPWATEKILDNLDGSFADLSVQKHSSNVVERCLKSASEEHRYCIIQELIDNPRFDQIMQDPFGNYVTQVALEKSKGNLYAKLVDAIKPHVVMLRTSPYGKKVLTCLSLKK